MDKLVNMFYQFTIHNTSYRLIILLQGVPRNMFISLRCVLCTAVICSTLTKDIFGLMESKHDSLVRGHLDLLIRFEAFKCQPDLKIKFLNS